MSKKKRVNIEVMDGAAASFFMRGLVLFMFDKETSKTIKGYVVDLDFAEKVAIQALCISSYLECIKDCSGECQENGLDAECRQAFKDCLYNTESFAEAARLVHSRFLEKIEEKEEVKE